MKIMHFAAIMMLGLFSATSGAIAQQRQPPIVSPQDNEFAPRQPDRSENSMRKIEAIRIARLAESLKLDEKTAAKFIPAVTAIEQKRRALMIEHRQLMHEIRQILGSQQIDEGKLKGIIEKMVNNQNEITKLRSRELDAAREHLSLEQQARYLLFQHDFMNEMREIMGGMRGPGAGRGMGSGSGRGAGPGRMGPPPAAPAE